MDKLKLFRNTIKNITYHSKRKLYTDHIYPYPFNYFNNVKYPSQVLYRESWPDPKWQKTHNMLGKNLMRFFWTYIWWSAFWDPGALGLVSHVHLPDPRKWTDEELGIPPDSYGSYEDWIKNNN